MFMFSSFYANEDAAPRAGKYPKNCKEVQDQGNNVSDFYLIQPGTSPEPFVALCDMKTRGGGWAYILNRYDGSQDFYMGWDSYKEGFGHIGGEFWLGLENIHQLTGYEINELLIEIVDWDDVQKFALYNAFSVGHEKSGYALKLVAGYMGDAWDCMVREAGMKFTTDDKDQDQNKDGNCALSSNSGWWFRNCKWAHLTGKYFPSSDAGSEYAKSMHWREWHGERYSLKQARMMVRPRREGHARLFPSSKFLNADEEA
ncbi:fibrinogen C domain-containing protein 1-like [Zophobas morio]|uniref:fibrinogen C domain-containing protein 1-like n=1 Tax=Zophobas morio TaxID=2755281 RepID=UPI003083B8AF